MKKSKWIWYRGDFELYHGMKLNSRREIRGLFYPPLWRVDGPQPYIRLYKIANLEKKETIRVFTNGECLVWINNEKHAPGELIELNEGRNFIKLDIYKPDGLPTAYCEGDTFASDETWKYSSWGLDDLHVGTSDMYTEKADDPEVFKFAYERIKPVSQEIINGGILFDFGKETFGKLIIKNSRISGGKAIVSYGESREEALDTSDAIITDAFDMSEAEHIYKSRACRYVYIGCENVDAEYDYEYIPLEYRGSFKCNDERINKILDVCKYTFHLNTRETFLDGIKRDRWVWGGDAYQSFFVDYYLFNDFEAIRRSVIALFGRPPFTRFANTIPDYTFLLLIGIYDYYVHSGDLEFLKFMYGKFDEVLRLIDTRLDSRGLFVGGSGDWVFIDWADTAKSGIVTAEQVLLCAAYEAMAKCAEVLNKDSAALRERARHLKELINELFWNEELGAFVDCIGRDDRVNVVTRHANIFALLYGICDEKRTERIIECVIKNKDVPAITTPYFEFFELDAMCMLGDFDYARNMISSYWGGMVDLGATTIWEEFDPTIENVPDHYAMYGQKYGKSLCHAWGASPIYILGRYALGVHPTSVGFETFEVEPNSMGFSSFSGSVPVMDGFVNVSFDGESYTVLTNKSGGTLIINGKKFELEAGKEFTVKA